MMFKHLGSKSRSCASSGSLLICERPQTIESDIDCSSVMGILSRWAVNSCKVLREWRSWGILLELKRMMYELRRDVSRVDIEGDGERRERRDEVYSETAEGGRVWRWETRVS